MTKLEIKLLSENATKPKRADDESAGYDIYASEDVLIEPQDKTLVSTDLAVNIPKGYVGLLTSRSGVSSKTHLVVETGKIDAGYQGHMKINVKNDEQHFRTVNIQDFDLNGEMIRQYINDRDIKPFEFNNRYQIKKGERLAQLVIVPIYTPELEPVEEFSNESERGEKGFGSSGTR